MRHGKTAALRCLPLATELLIVFLTADILWQLLCGRPPFSMFGFLFSGGLMAAGNTLFLRKPRRFWQILLLNALLCAVWIPLLSRTLDLTYPPLLVIQVPLYLFPLCRGYHWGVTPVTVLHLHSAGEYMGLYGLFYLIVASFTPQLLDRVPVLLALLLLDLLAVVGMRTSGRNTIRAGSPFGRLPALLIPAVLAALAVAACALLLAARGELIPIFQAIGSFLQGALIAVFRFLTSLLFLFLHLYMLVSHCLLVNIHLLPCCQILNLCLLLLLFLHICIQIFLLYLLIYHLVLLSRIVAMSLCEPRS